MDVISPAEAQILISTLEHARTLEGGIVPGLDTASLLNQVRISTAEPGQIVLQMQFIRTVVSIILNIGIDASSAPREPRIEQLDSIRRIVYELGDTILLAKTGFGKSIVFQAVSVLRPDMVTILIAPLTMLAEEQRKTIARFPNTRPIVIDQSVTKDKAFWESLQSGKYTHILLGPEQALHWRFIRLLRSADFNRKIAFVGIDELHTVYQWRSFRTSYPNLYQLRNVLPSRIPWFGCTATLTRDGEAFVRSAAGFRHETSKVRPLKVIRTSLDRPEIAIVIQGLSPGSLKDFRRLEFLLKPELNGFISKTIIYIDNKKSLTAARHYLIGVLAAMDGYNIDSASMVIAKYNADVRMADQIQIYEDFRREISTCRIMLATVSLGMGMDIPDVKRVVQYGALLSRDLADLWQRFGRAVRAGGVGFAYFFAPYWYFDRLGKPEEGTSSLAGTTLHARSRLGLSRLRLTATQENDDVESIASTTYSNASFILGDYVDLNPAITEDDQPPPIDNKCGFDPVYGIFGNIKTKTWSGQDKHQRLKLSTESPELYRFANASCFRKAILDTLQDTGPHNAPRTHCCNACFNKLGKLPPMSEKLVAHRAPSKNTRQWYILQELVRWATEKAEELYPDIERLFDFPREEFMLDGLMNPLVQYLASNDYRDCNKEVLFSRVPCLSEWEWVDEYGQQLIEECPRLRRAGLEAFNRYRATKKTAISHATQHPVPRDLVPTPATPNPSFSSDNTLVPASTGVTARGTPVVFAPALKQIPAPSTSMKRRRHKDSVGASGRAKK